MDEAAEEARWALDRARKYRVDFTQQNLLVRLTGLALARCEFEEFHALAEESRIDNYAFDLQRVAYHEWRGDPERAIRLIPSPSRAANVPPFVMQLAGGAARALFNAGHPEAARHELEIARDLWSRLPENDLGIGPTRMLAELDDALPELLEADELQALYEKRRGDGDPLGPDALPELGTRARGPGTGARPPGGGGSRALAGARVDERATALGGGGP